MDLLDSGGGAPRLPTPEEIAAAQAAYQSGAGITPSSGGLYSIPVLGGLLQQTLAPVVQSVQNRVQDVASNFGGGPAAFMTPQDIAAANDLFKLTPAGSGGVADIRLPGEVLAGGRAAAGATGREITSQAGRFPPIETGGFLRGESGAAHLPGGESELEQQLAASIAARSGKAFGVTPASQAAAALNHIPESVRSQVRKLARGEEHTLTDESLQEAIDAAMKKAKVPATAENRTALLDALSKDAVARNTGGAANNAARKQAVQAVTKPAQSGFAAGSPRGPLAQRIASRDAAVNPGAAANEALATAQGKSFQPGTGGALKLAPDTRVPQVVGGKSDITNVALAMRAAGATDEEIAAYLKVKPADLPKGEPPVPPRPPVKTAETPKGEPPKASPNRPWNAFLDLWNLPKALKASWDLSAPGRQGILTAAAHPTEFFGNFKPMIQAFASTKFAHAVDAELRAGPKSEVVQQGLANLGLAGRSPRLFLADHAGLSGREEAFMTRLAGKIPLIKNSEQAYITYLNKLRADIYDNTLERWFEHGKNVTPADVDGLADVVNHFTGRGDLTFGQELTPVLNGLFFSPRFAISRVQSVGDALGALKSRDSLAAKEAANMMVKSVVAGMSILALAKFAGSPVEPDPRSANFGKIVVGNTTYDIWGGQQQIARYVAQFVAGQTKPSSGATKGKIVTANRGQTLGRFVQSKLSPSAGTAAVIIGYTPSKKDPKGTIARDFVGRPFGAKDLVNPTSPDNLYIPLIGQDFADAYADLIKQGGTAAGAAVKTIPSFFGISTSTH